MIYKFFKRFLDLFLALIIFILALPLFIVIYLLVAYFMGTPVFFKQKRTGKGMKNFYIYKFRTMKNKTNANETDKQRLTKFGTLLRKTSLDELPQLINIISGDMSFIGPRPLIEEYNKYYYENELNRFDVRPGMSGYAEAKGRHSISWSDQFKYDNYYVENLSLLLDIKIVLLTIPKVLNVSNVSSLNRTDGQRLDKIRKQQR